METSVAVKAYLMGSGKAEAEIHRFYLETEQNAAKFETLKEKILTLFPQLRLAAHKIQIQYKDEEGDMIVLSSDEELSLALNSPSKDSLFRIYITTPGGRCGRRRMMEDGASDVHTGVVCDGCDGPLQGFRYKCMVCPDYDLCGPCENKKLHSQHVMMRFPTPFNLVNFFSFPQHLTGSNARIYYKKGHWGGHGHGHGYRQFGHHQFKHCYEKWKKAARKGYEAAAAAAASASAAAGATGATAGTPSEGPNASSNGQRPENPFQNLIETFASHLNAFVNPENKDKAQVPEPQELLKNVGDVVQNVLDQMGMAADVSTQHNEQGPSDCQMDTSDEEKNSGSSESENEPLLGKNGDKETVEGWTYVKDQSTVDSALDAMLAMGFTNEGGWLKQLLEIKHGNIDAVLEVLAPVAKAKTSN